MFLKILVADLQIFHGKDVDSEEREDHDDDIEDDNEDDHDVKDFVPFSFRSSYKLRRTLFCNSQWK